MREHWHERALLASLGVKELDMVDDKLSEAAELVQAKVDGTDRGARARRVAEFVAAAGGDA